MKFKKGLICFIATLSIFGSSNVLASGAWTQFLPVLEVYSYSTGEVFLRLDPVSGHVNPSGCGVDTIVRVDADQKNTDTILKIALTAKASGKKLSLYISGCSNNYPKVLHVRLRD